MSWFERVGVRPGSAAASRRNGLLLGASAAQGRSFGGPGRAEARPTFEDAGHTGNAHRDPRGDGQVEARCPRATTATPAPSSVRMNTYNDVGRFGRELLHAVPGGNVERRHRSRGRRRLPKCPKGKWCSAGKEIPCSRGFYNDVEGGDSTTRVGERRAQEVEPERGRAGRGGGRRGGCRGAISENEVYQMPSTPQTQTDLFVERSPHHSALRTPPRRRSRRPHSPPAVLLARPRPEAEAAEAAPQPLEGRERRRRSWQGAV